MSGHDVPVPAPSVPVAARVAGVLLQVVGLANVAGGTVLALSGGGGAIGATLTVLLGGVVALYAGRLVWRGRRVATYASLLALELLLVARLLGGDTGAATLLVLVLVVVLAVAAWRLHGRGATAGPVRPGRSGAPPGRR